MEEVLGIGGGSQLQVYCSLAFPSAQPCFLHFLGALLIKPPVLKPVSWGTLPKRMGMGTILVYKPHSPCEPICFISSHGNSLQGSQQKQPSYKDALHLEKPI